MRRRVRPRPRRRWPESEEDRSRSGVQGSVTPEPVLATESWMSPPLITLSATLITVSAALISVSATSIWMSGALGSVSGAFGGVSAAFGKRQRGSAGCQAHLAAGQTRLAGRQSGAVARQAQSAAWEWFSDRGQGSHLRWTFSLCRGNPRVGGRSRLVARRSAARATNSTVAVLVVRPQSTTDLDALLRRDRDVSLIEKAMEVRP
jgi:hypothetical protein